MYVYMLLLLPLLSTSIYENMLSPSIEFHIYAILQFYFAIYIALYYIIYIYKYIYYIYKYLIYYYYLLCIHNRCLLCLF